jgi:hypothetical protein
MAPKTKLDPLEAAKLTPERSATADDLLDRKDWTAPPADATPTSPATQAPPAAAPPANTEPAPSAPRQVYRVRRAEQRNVGGGQVHLFKVGQLLDPVHYGGKDRLDRLRLDLECVLVEGEGRFTKVVGVLQE